MTGKADPMRRRPHRANKSLAIVRGIKTAKAIYCTTGRLRKLLPGVFSTARERHYAKAVAVLRNWPERTRQQNIEAASRINPRRLMGNRWSWPKSAAAMMREYADRAPEESIDTEKLRATLDGMDRRTRERFMDLVIEALPLVKAAKIDWRLFRKIVSAHTWLIDAIRRDPDPNIREIDISQKAVIPGRWEARYMKDES